MEVRGRVSLNWLILFIAEGFGTGRFPVAPGTFGTLAGFVWIYLLLIPNHLAFYIGGMVVGVLVAVWIGARAEKILQRKDPGSIVIDEIVALPLAFLGAVIVFSKGSQTPGFSHYLTVRHGLDLVVAFMGFRIFDITKPWLIGRSQNLPGGWGLVMDDVLAALVVAPITFFTARLF